MRVCVYWSARLKSYSIRAMTGRCAGKVIGHASTVIIREPRYTAKGEICGQLEAYKGDATDEGFRCHVIPLWTSCDILYLRHARATGQLVEYRSTNPAGWFVQGETQALISKGEMALLERKRKGRTALEFDPLTMPTNG
jgi:hypothetical protein